MEITSKKVTRWYFKGRGYSSKKLAYKKWAYRLLLDDILGENVIKVSHDDFGNSYEENKGRPAVEGLTDDEAKAKMHDLFADKFPHEVSPGCGSVCRMNYENVWTSEGPDVQEDGFYYASCKAAQQDWIDNKAQELMNESK